MNQTVTPRTGGASFTVEKAYIGLVEDYLENARNDFDAATSCLRTEDEAQAFCRRLGTTAGTTRTKSTDHHQSSKALVAAVTAVAAKICSDRKSPLVSDPQRRCVWCNEDTLHVSARNLDGAVPDLLNPRIVWEIKEYWGLTGGGSKMSDAVYECHLFGRELRDFELRSHFKVSHIVFLDGKVQWESRKSDLVRFIDLFHQGLIDHLLVGRDVETEWEQLIASLVDEHIAEFEKGKAAAAPLELF